METSMRIIMEMKGHEIKISSSMKNVGKTAIKKTICLLATSNISIKLINFHAIY